jgi:outer membrane receptor protein involved in Fe transport
MNKLFLSFVFVFSAIAVPGLFAQESNLVLEEVVVTATKKEENVQDIAQTVNALTDSVIDDYQIRDIGEIAQLVSGVEFTQIDPRRATITMRGQKLDPDGGNDQPIQVYIDEMPVRPNVAFNTMYDTQRIEVLKGTQGTLQGVVSVGGALQIYTRDATVGSNERNGYVKNTIADNSMNMIEFASDFHLSETLALRVAGLTNSSNGHERRNLRTGVDENHNYDSYRLSLTWKPNDNLTARLKYTNMEGKFIAPRPVAGSEGPITLNPAAYVNPLMAGFSSTQTFATIADAMTAIWPFLTSAVAGTDAASFYSSIYRKPDLSLIGNPSVGSNVAFHNYDPLQNNSGETLNLLVDYQLNSHILALRYSNYENDTQGILDRDIIGAYHYGFPQEVRTNAGIDTFEVRLSSSGDSALEYTFGFFNRDSQTYTHADLDATGSTLNMAYPAYSALPLAPGVNASLVASHEYDSPFDACEAGRDPSVFAMSFAYLVCYGIPLDNETTAFFANFKYNLSDQTFIEFGFRDQEIDVYTSQQQFYPKSFMAPGVEVEAVAKENQNRSNESTTGNFKIGHFIEDDVLLYVARESGVRGPGRTITPTAISDSLIAFDEEDTDMTEIGMKGLFLDGRLKLNIAYFQYDFEGFQTKWDGPTARTYKLDGSPDATAQVQGGIFTNNDAELTGFDVEYQYIVNENLILGGSYSNNESEYGSGSVAYVTDTSYTGMLAATTDITGLPLNDATENSWTFYLDHSVPFMDGERYTRYNINWRDSRKSIANQDINIGELYLANLYFGYRSGDGVWDANVFIKNVLDDQDLSFISPYYSDFSVMGFGGIQTKLYEANTNMGRQIGMTVTYRF